MKVFIVNRRSASKKFHPQGSVAKTWQSRA